MGDRVSIFATPKALSLIAMTPKLSIRAYHRQLMSTREKLGGEEHKAAARFKEEGGRRKTLQAKP
jgi:hypothetical protein